MLEKSNDTYVGHLQRVLSFILFFWLLTILEIIDFTLPYKQIVTSQQWVEIISLESKKDCIFGCLFKSDINNLLFKSRMHETCLRWAIQLKKIQDNFMLKVLHPFSLLKTIHVNTLSTRPMGQFFKNGPEDWGSIPCWVIPKTQKIVLDASLLNIQHYQVWIKSKVE